MKIQQIIKTPLPSVAVFEVDIVPFSHNEFAREFGPDKLGTLLGGTRLDLASISPDLETSYHMIRDPKAGIGRDWWTPDHAWHIDGTRHQVQPEYTVIGCHKAAKGVPDTEILDSAKLLDISIKDGFWVDRGCVVAELKSVFVDSTYQREALPYYEDLATVDDKKSLEKTHSADLKKFGAEDQKDLLVKMDVLNPAKQFQLVQSTDVLGRSALFLDAGVRNSTLLTSDGSDLKLILNEFRLSYLSGDTPHKLGIVAAVEWAPNKCVIFPQRGTLLRAMPGNDLERHLNLAFLKKY
jgi:hypothetical protein